MCKIDGSMQHHRKLLARKNTSTQDKYVINGHIISKTGVPHTIIYYRYHSSSLSIINRLYKQFKIKMNKQIFLLFTIFLLITNNIIISSSCVSIMAAESSLPSSTSEAAVHIIYTEKPTDQEPEAYHLKTLASVLGRYPLLCFLQFVWFLIPWF